MRLDYHKVPLQTLHSCEHLRIRVSSEDRRGLLKTLKEGRKEDRSGGRKVGPKVGHSEDRRVGLKVGHWEDQRVALRDLLEEVVVWIPYGLPVRLALEAPL